MRAKATHMPTKNRKARNKGAKWAYMRAKVIRMPMKGKENQKLKKRMGISAVKHRVYAHSLETKISI